MGRTGIILVVVALVIVFVALKNHQRAGGPNLALVPARTA